MIPMRGTGQHPQQGLDNYAAADTLLNRNYQDHNKPCNSLGDGEPTVMFTIPYVCVLCIAQDTGFSAHSREATSPAKSNIAAA